MYSYNNIIRSFRENDTYDDKKRLSSMSVEHFQTTISCSISSPLRYRFCLVLLVSSVNVQL